jgi:hypothetical protein
VTTIITDSGSFIVAFRVEFNLKATLDMARSVHDLGTLLTFDFLR